MLKRVNHSDLCSTTKSNNDSEATRKEEHVNSCGCACCAMKIICCVCASAAQRKSTHDCNMNATSTMKRRYAVPNKNLKIKKTNLSRIQEMRFYIYCLWNGGDLHQGICQNHVYRQQSPYAARISSIRILLVHDLCEDVSLRFHAALRITSVASFIA